MASDMHTILQKLGFSDKAARVYVALLSLGPSSVRQIAGVCDLNRGTTYDALKWLQDAGVVSFYKKESKQHFVAEDPRMLARMMDERQVTLDATARELEQRMPELQALHHSGGERPVARYFAADELKHILEDVLASCEDSEEKMYRIYSPVEMRTYLYDDFPTFSDARVAKGIAVKAIAIGAGGELRGLDERKWLEKIVDPPTYIIIYPGKTAYISLDAKDEPVGVVIENAGVSAMQQVIFDQLWETVCV